MHMVFIYGPPAAGKFTIAKALSEKTGLPLFHNHLIVDSVGAVFPFGTPNFVRLREKFWLETIEAAVAEDRSLIFTYQPENSVSPDFPHRVKDLVQDRGNTITFIRLELSREGQLTRIANSDRGAFGKLRDPDLLAANFEQFENCVSAMPNPQLTIDTATVSAGEAATEIAELLAPQLQQFAPRHP